MNIFCVWILAGGAWAQQSSTATATSTTTVAAVSRAAPPAVRAASAPKGRVRVGLDAADWKPVSVRLVHGGSGRTFFERQVRRGRGDISAAGAVARLHPAEAGRQIIVSVYPASLRTARTHLEARFLVAEGELEEAAVAAVTVAGGLSSPEDEKEDSVTLRAKGIDFLEESPSSARIVLSALDPGPGRAANVGRVKDASFADMSFGVLNFSWNLSRVVADRPDRGARRPNRP